MRRYTKDIRSVTACTEDPEPIEVDRGDSEAIEHGAEVSKLVASDRGAI